MKKLNYEGVALILPPAFLKKAGEKYSRSPLGRGDKPL